MISGGGGAGPESETPARVGLGEEVFIWRAELDRTGSELESLTALLSASERERADRFHFERDRRRFLAARGMLRKLLSGYTGVSPQELEFTYGPQGKPSLASDGAGSGVEFNVSHSNGVALFAFTCGATVGVDIEFIRSDIDCTELATSVFSPWERAELERLPATLRNEAFFACWTRKEAYIKALGGGLSVPLHRFDVSLTPGGPARLLRDRGDPNATQRWVMDDIDAGPGYRAALVVKRPGAKPRFFEWGNSRPLPFDLRPSLAARGKCPPAGKTLP
ncbi:MAG: 4'-phosphopantetheinyl transferase family protein [Bryobacteraceae bacterium]